MKDNLTDITIILDRSGSMETIKSSTIEGFNKFIDDQRKVEGEASITLVQFDHDYDIVYTNRDVKEAPYLTSETFAPRGTTALLDAIGKTINSTGERLRNMDRKNRPGKIIMVIITDGYENYSIEFSKEKVFEMIRHQTDKYSWNFVFLAANEDAIATAASYGIHVGNAMSYSHDSAGASDAFRSISCSTATLRSSSSATTDKFFSDKDKK